MNPPPSSPDPPDPKAPPAGEAVSPSSVAGSTPAGVAALAQLLALQRAGQPYAPLPLFGITGPVGSVAGPAGTPVQHTQQLQVWQGQFPPPDAVQKYEAVLPGSFDRIIRMAERLQEAQIDETKRAQDYTRDDARRGHWLGFGATIAAILAAVVCAAIAAVTHVPGLLWVAGALVGVPVMAVAKSLVETARVPSPTDLLRAVEQPAQSTTSPPSPPGSG